MLTRAYIRKDYHVKWILKYTTVEEAWLHANLDHKLCIIQRAPELFDGIRGDSKKHNLLDVIRDRVERKDIAGITLRG